MLPVGAYVLLEEFEVFTLNLPVSPLLISAILMLLLQFSNVALASANQEGGMRPITILTAIFFSLPAVYYFLSLVMTLPLVEYISFFLGSLMIAEALYALH